MKENSGCILTRTTFVCISPIARSLKRDEEGTVKCRMAGNSAIVAEVLMGQLNTLRNRIVDSAQESKGKRNQCVNITPVGKSDEFHTQYNDVQEDVPA